MSESSSDSEGSAAAPAPAAATASDDSAAAVDDLRCVWDGGKFVNETDTHGKNQAVQVCHQELEREVSRHQESDGTEKTREG